MPQKGKTDSRKTKADSRLKAKLEAKAAAGKAHLDSLDGGEFEIAASIKTADAAQLELQVGDIGKGLCLCKEGLLKVELPAFKQYKFYYIAAADLVNLKVTKASPVQRVQLLEEDGSAAKGFKMVLVQLFGQHDEDKDRVLSRKELNAFSVAANEDDKAFADEELDQIKQFFDWSDSGPPGGGLTLRGWIQMYVTQTAGDEEETWRDLRTFGYDKELKPREPKVELEATGEAAPAPPAEKKQTKVEALQARLNEYILLGESQDYEGFVDAFVGPDLGTADRADFLQRLKGEGDEPPMLPSILAEVRSCAMGEGVFEIEGESKKNGPVVFKFHSQEAGAERIDREVSFIRADGQWHTEG